MIIFCNNEINNNKENNLENWRKNNSHIFCILINNKKNEYKKNRRDLQVKNLILLLNINFFRKN